MALKFQNGKWSIDNFASIYWQRSAKCEDPHTHDFVEFVYLRKGKCTHLLNDVQYPTTHGNLLLINYSVQHTIVCEDEIEYYNILVKPEAINESMRDAGNAFSLLALKDFADFQETVDQNNCLIRFDGQDRAKFESLLEWFACEQKQHRSGNTLVRRSILNMLLVMIFRKMALPMHREVRKLDGDLLQYICKHCGQRITVDSLAQQCGYNPSYFSRIFKEYTGKTFREYLNWCRIEKACRLLQDTAMPVDDVIAECGYSDRTKFFRSFADIVGTTPLKYRKKKDP